MCHQRWTLHVITRNSSGDEIANVNFLYDDIVQVVQNARLVHKFRRKSRHVWKLIFLLVINTNLPHVLHRFQVMADYSSNFR